MLDPSPYGIFLNYRRKDSAPYARLLREELTKRFPGTRVFIDVESIEAGQDFAEVIRQAVESCAVLVALVGPRWATIEGRDGRRLDDPGDLVREEIRTALQMGVRVIPVLVDDAKPLWGEDLPDDLLNLARLNALKLSHDRYEDDLRRLLSVIERILAEPAAGPDTPDPEALRRIGAAEVAILRHPSKVGLFGSRNVHAVAFSPDGSLLASGSDDKSVRLWELPGGKIRQVLAHPATVTDVVFSPAGELIATGSTDGRVRVSDIATGETRHTLGSYPLLEGVAFSPDGRLLACGAGPEVLIWEMPGGEFHRTVPIGGWLTRVAFSPDGNRLAATGGGGDIVVWNLLNDVPVFRLDKRSGSPIKAVAFSADGRFLATVDGVNVRLWEPPAEKPRVTPGIDVGTSAVAFSPDGRNMAASSSVGRKVRVWDLADDLQEALHLDHRNYPNAVAYSPDGQLLAVGTGGNRVVLWRLVSAEG
ncbi:toll/interleukin-1 receptor domain-containing protein [Paractinoplanes rishiriensis]|uniref:toll/interleukin-1 receptor domain-containing protein n=1 Tax=Paractinoplanes rishiriensis TaxID=1050105 RepID=UPI00194093D1|nr:TIR domain-containing protein [Actinoplanes rishiriensis]